MPIICIANMEKWSLFWQLCFKNVYGLCDIWVL